MIECHPYTLCLTKVMKTLMSLLYHFFVNKNKKHYLQYCLKYLVHS